MVAPHLGPYLLWVAPGREASRRHAEVRLLAREFTRADRNERVERQVDQLLGAIPARDVRPADSKIAGGVRDYRAFEPGGIRLDAAARRRGSTIERVHQRRAGLQREGGREILSQHLHSATHHDSATFGEETRRVRNVRAGRREEVRRRVKLGDDLPHAHRCWCILHGHQVVHAVGQGRRIDHGIAPPVLEGLLFEEPAVDDAVENTLVHAFVRRETGRSERAQSGTFALERSYLATDRTGGEIVEEFVVLVDAIPRRDGGVAAREAVEVAIDESRELVRLGSRRGSERQKPDPGQRGVDET